MRRLRSIPLLAVLSCVLGAAPAADVTLTEFLAVNGGGLLDFFGDGADWIEVHNSGTAAVDLVGWHLTDDEDEPAKWTFPAVVVGPGEYLVVFASGLDLVVGANELHTNFKLTSSGEYLALVDPGGVIATEYAPAFPEQFSDISYGVGVDGVTVGYLSPPTPGAPNSILHEHVGDIEFSSQRGFYQAPFDLALTAESGAVEVRYTLDGEVPTATTGLVYTTPIAIGTTAIVTAAGFHLTLPSIGHPVTHTYIFPSDVFNQTDASAHLLGFPTDWIEEDGTNWEDGGGGGLPGASYGLDPVIMGALAPQDFVDALQDIPSISLVMPLDDWFGHDPATGTYGIYVNSEGDGEAWERACSIEYIDPSGGAEFQVNGGINVQGGSSTGESLRSHLSLAIKFKKQYGPSKLEFDLFDGSSAEDHEILILDAGNQHSIHSKGSLDFKSHAQGLRDQYIANMEIALGAYAPYGRLVHTYVNGLYWGAVTLHERPDDSWAAAHFGGDDTEYDWIKSGAIYSGNNNSASHPTAPGAWKVLAEVVAGGLSPSDTYGGGPSYGVFQDYVDVDGYIDYLLVNFYGGNKDWPSKNWYATAHSRTGPFPEDINPDLQFQFHSWDAEAVLWWGGAVTDVGGFYDLTQHDTYFLASATYFHTILKQDNPEYVVRFGDRAHEHLFNGGALYVDPAYAFEGTLFDPAHPERNRPASVYHELAESFEVGMIGEYARWGNYFQQPGDVQPANWYVERDRILNDYTPIRSNVLLAQLENSGLYPDLDAPSFGQHGGQVALGYDLAMAGPMGATIYYTLDGSDPRLDGGAIDPGALVYVVPVGLDANVTVSARAHDGLEWSALNKADFFVGLNVVISEFMADNRSTIVDETGAAEDWIELYNGGGAAVDLGGMYLTDDLGDPTQWEIPAGTVLAAKERLLIWADDDVGDGPFHTNFKLGASGEEVGLFETDAAGNALLDAIGFGPQEADVSTGRLLEDGGPLVRLLDPSPGAPNLPAPGQSVRYDSAAIGANTPTLGAASAPAIGSTFSVDVGGAAAAAPGLAIFGIQPSHVAFGQEGVLLSTPILPALWEGLLTSGIGSASADFAIPNKPGIVGSRLFFQAWVFGSGLSNGVAATLGP